jgi:aspartate/methionine/tyrosine aminotransferase
VNLVLTLCDAGDSVVMFAPYYFNAYMSFQMTGITNILVGPGNTETLYPDAGKTLYDPITSTSFLPLEDTLEDYLMSDRH